MNDINAAVDGQQRTLRLALAMRGGVSLAVWIGGVVAELDLFRRACSGQISPFENDYRQARAREYATLLRDCTHYDCVKIDILAGASAGGLNAVLYGLAQSSNTVLDEIVRNTWVKRGGIWDLLRPTLWHSSRREQPSAHERDGHTAQWRVLSILQGDDALYKLVHNALQLIAGDAPPPADKSPVDPRYPLTYGPSATGEPRVLTVELAATLLGDPYSPARGNRASFSFRKTAGGLDSGFTTIPARSEIRDASGRTALERLALAARSTSSFPGAFEPAQILSATRESDLEEAGSPDKRSKLRLISDVNMAAVFPDARTNDPEARIKPFRVVDGGIFDNIPIDRTINVIRRATGAHPSERRLIYIDPEPPREPLPVNQSGQRAVAGLLAVLRSSFTLKQRTETAADELALIRAHNESVLANRERLKALATFLDEVEFQDSPQNPPTPDQGPLSILTSENLYRQYRITQDAQRIADLLTNPWAELCLPPRPAVDYVPLPAVAALTLQTQVADEYQSQLPITSTNMSDWSLSTDIYAMLDWVRILTAWVRALQKLPPAAINRQFGNDDKAVATTLSEHKLRLHRYRLVLTEATHESIDEVLARPLESARAQADRDKYSLGPYLSESRAKQCALTITAQFARLLRGELPKSQSTEHAFYEELAQVVTSWRGSQAADPNFREVLATDLEALRCEVARIDPPTRGQAPPGSDPSDALGEWNALVYRHFHHPTLKEMHIRDLAKVFALTGIPDTAPVIDFNQITSDEPPRIGIEALESGARARVLSTWVRNVPTSEQAQATLTDPLTVRGADAKLAGNVLSRFGGFLLARWRENDWQWGRLDAAAGIVGILQDSPRNLVSPAQQQLATLSNAAELLQDSVLAESKVTTGTALDSQHLGIVQTVGAEGMEAISAHYRFALLSRIVALVLRALAPANGSGASLTAVMTQMGLLIVRPLAVVVPLFADPLRLASAIVVIVSSAGLLGAHDLGSLSRGIFGVAMTGLGIWMIYRACQVKKRWDDVAQLLSSAAGLPERPSDLPKWQELFDEARKERVWRISSIVLGVVAMVVGLYELIGLWWERIPFHVGVPAENAALVLFLVLGLQHWLNERAQRISVRSASPRLSTRSQRSRLLRTTVSCLVVIGAIAGAALSSLISANCAALSSLTRCPLSSVVAASTAAILTFVSLWGWARGGCVFATAVVTAGVAAGAQWSLDEYWPGGHQAVFDLLPTAVWLWAVGLLLPRLPFRTAEDADIDTAYGETGRPTITTLYAAPKSVASATAF